jgi:nitroimidazol reductase NimA-like FMN-containing flavoprotein (pyridoxamine 5'-phosphate oxidase superfamily)
MFREMRRKDKQLSVGDSEKVLFEGQIGVLSTINAKGFPYVTPLNYVYYNNHIFFHSAVAGEKLDNIKQNDKVSFCVISYVKLLPETFDTDYKSVVVFGRAIEANDEEKEEALHELVKKYSSEYIEGGKKHIEKFRNNTRVVKIVVERMTGKAQI